VNITIADEKKLENASDALEKKLSPLEISDKTTAPLWSPEADGGHKQSDYLAPTLPTLVKPRPGRSFT